MREIATIVGAVAILTCILYWVTWLKTREPDLKYDETPSKEIKYIIHPGDVRASDGDEHYIGALVLMRLYGVSRRECIIDNGIVPGSWRRSMTHLYPRPSGDYELPMPARRQQ